MNALMGSAILWFLMLGAVPRVIAPATPYYTYSATQSMTLPTGSALNDFFTMQGSASAVIYITSMEKQCSVATAVTSWTNVMVRRTSETGGTFRAWAAKPYDSKAPAATATIGDYSLGLTSGNSGGSVFMDRHQDRLIVNNTGTLQDLNRFTWGKGWARSTHNGQVTATFPSLASPAVFRPASPLVLRGTNDILALTTSASFANAVTCRFIVEWFEVPNN